MAKPESPLSRVPLWQWGLLLIVAGLVANFAVGELMPQASGSAAARGQAAGRMAVMVLAVVAGVVLIVMHFVRRKPAPAKRKKPGAASPPKSQRRPGDRKRQ